MKYSMHVSRRAIALQPKGSYSNMFFKLNYSDKQLADK